MNINEHTGKEMRTGHATKAYTDGWERIFGKGKKDGQGTEECQAASIQGKDKESAHTKLREDNTGVSDA